MILVYFVLILGSLYYMLLFFKFLFHLPKNISQSIPKPMNNVVPENNRLGRRRKATEGGGKARQKRGRGKRNEILGTEDGDKYM